MANDEPRVDGAEAHLLLAELAWFKAKLGKEGIEAVIGCSYGPEFHAKCIGLYSVSNHMKANGYPFDLRSGPTPVLEAALKALWDAAPEEEFWRAKG
jgi:hypothetical protein